MATARVARECKRAVGCSRVPLPRTIHLILVSTSERLLLGSHGELEAEVVEGEVALLDGLRGSKFIENPI